MCLKLFVALAPILSVSSQYLLQMAIELEIKEGLTFQSVVMYLMFKYK
jgi:hypothetical protein